jgi:uncharacterized iron-regulated membrane protein
MASFPAPSSASDKKTGAAPAGFHGAFRQSMSWLHTWVGLVLGVVLYFMFVTGTTGYVKSHITRWMEPERGVLSEATAKQALPHSSEAMAEAAFAHGMKDVKEWKAFYLVWPVAGSTEQSYSAYGEGHAPAKEGEEAPSMDVKFDAATLALQSDNSTIRQTGGGDALYAMHYNLHYMPENPIKIGDYSIAWPTLIVGSATIFMLIAIITGIVVHKKIFADFFTFRPGKGQRSWLDAHNLSSVLALPFMIAITYSGLIFYTYEYMPSVKAATYGLSEEANKAFEKERGELYQIAQLERAGIAAPPIAPSAPLAKAREVWGKEPQWIDYYNAGDANARIVVWAASMQGALSGEGYQTLMFDGVTGALLPTPAAATASNPAKTIGDVMIAIHEGHFAGPALRWLMLVMGASGAAMIATGLVLWTAKRKQKLKVGERVDLGIAFVDRSNVGIIAGLLIAIGVYFWANRLLPVGMEGRGDWEMHCLFIAWGVMMAHALLRPTIRSWTEQWSIAALVFGLLPVLNAFTTDIHLGRTLLVPLAEQDLSLASFDLVSLALGAVFAALAARGWRRREAGNTARTTQTQNTTIRMEPAE